MKKIIAFLLCLNIVISAAACAEGNRPDDINNGFQPNVSEPETEDKPHEGKLALYNEALSLLKSGDLYGAYDIFLTIPEVEDAGEYLSRFSFGYEQELYDSEDTYSTTHRKTCKEYDEYGRLIFLKIIYNYDTDNSFESTYGYIYDENNNLTETQYDGVTDYRYEYDGDGNVIKMTYIHPPKRDQVMELEYDESGNITKIIYDFNRFNEKKYNENGKIIEEKVYISGGYIFRTTYYEYNEYGDIVRETTCGPEETSLVYEYKNEYDEAGRLTKCTWIINGEISSRTEYTYHESAILKEEIHFDGAETEYQYKYEYNGKGQFIARSYRSSFRGGYVKDYYEYDENGNRIKSTFKYPDGTVGYEYYEYDKYGNELSYIKTGDYEDEIIRYRSGYKLYYKPHPSKPLPSVPFIGK